MKYTYVDELRLNSKNRQQLVMINQVVEKYQRQGYRLSLRQLYYQLVTMNIIQNEKKEYAKLSTLLTKGRMAGVVDWDAIEDRLRKPYIPYWVKDRKHALQDTINQYRLNRMEGQPNYLEVWVEKDALSEVLKRSTNPYHVRVMVNRGYSSTSAMHDAFQRFHTELQDGNCEKAVILYLGDHDPSGMDMVRDIRERIKLFFWGVMKDEYDQDEFDSWFEEHFEVVRIALNGDQIKQYNPPPNPAKFSDPRATNYIREHGRQSWEVDALPPEVLHGLVKANILKRIDLDLYNALVKKEKEDCIFLKEIMSIT